MSALLEHVGTPELIFIAFVVMGSCIRGLPALLVAKARGRRPVAWFFLGIGISTSAMGAYALVLPSAPQIVACIGVLVAPAILMSLPRLETRTATGNDAEAG